ncbi:hypothetical protein PHMEG_00014707 [Phytophthora megakarya]|uniref:Bzip transcription factor n=1 Tax=Phytophthora megakarya TaxID=4795 RepID=A0A225W4P6_9STRA|nr:hypothetical protein PHMEG_00014707 [Phytophthora megakarya]
MNFITLHPPNSSLLSEDIVFSVTQSSRRARTNVHYARTTSSHSIQDSSKKNSSKKTSRETKQDYNLGMRWHKEEITQLIRLGDKIKQEQRQKARQRYRDKKIHLKLILQKEIRNLHNEVQALKKRTRKKAIEVAVRSSNTVWNAAVRYFNVFQHCLRLPIRSNISGTQFDSLLNFVRETTAPDVLSSEGYGPEALVRSLNVWQKFDGVNMELEEMISANVVVATTKTTATITEQTLKDVFPYLVVARAGGSTLSLVEQLCGQQIILLGSTRFVWDRESDRLASIISESDMLTPMLYLLGILEDASLVFERTT